MISLTPVAIEKIQSILAGQKEVGGLRIAVIGSGCSGFQYKMTLDREPGKKDEVIDMEGIRLFIDQESILYLNGTRIDYVESNSGSGFKFENPNPPANCGCGETFEA